MGVNKNFRKTKVVWSSAADLTATVALGLFSPKVSVLFPELKTSSFLLAAENTGLSWEVCWSHGSLTADRARNLPKFGKQPNRCEAQVMKHPKVCSSVWEQKAGTP